MNHIKKTLLASAILAVSQTTIGATLAHQTSPQKLIKAAGILLKTDGYELTLVDSSSGQLITNAKAISFTPDEVDCGKKLGFSYTKDKRTTISAAYTVLANKDSLEVTVKLYGRLDPGYGAPVVDLTCSSFGKLESKLAERIIHEAYNLPAEPEISQSDIAAPSPSAVIAPTAAEPEPSKPLISKPKTPDQAVVIFNAALNIEEINFRDAVTLRLDYENKTNKRIIGVSVRVIVKNAFGKETLNTKLDDEISIPAGGMTGNVSPWYWQDNPFIKDQPYDKMAASVQNDTAKITTKILKVIFEDGTSVTAPIPKK